VLVVVINVCLIYGSCAGVAVSRTRPFKSLLNWLTDSNPSENSRVALTLLSCLVFVALPLLVIALLEPDWGRQAGCKDQNPPQ
jgi:hypothetical protein